MDIDADPYLERRSTSSLIWVDKVRFGRLEVGQWESGGAKCADRQPVIWCDGGSDDVWVISCDECDIVQLFREPRGGRIGDKDSRGIPFERDRSSQTLTREVSA